MRKLDSCFLVESRPDCDSIWLNAFGRVGGIDHPKAAENLCSAVHPGRLDRNFSFLIERFTAQATASAREIPLKAG